MTHNNNTYRQLLGLHQPVGQLIERGVAHRVRQHKLITSLVGYTQTTRVAQEAVRVGEDLHGAKIEHLHHGCGDLVRTLGNVINSESHDVVALE